MKLQIAIDGPAGAGKSTVACGVAERLRYVYVDTGAMYRALTWAALQQHIAPDNATTLAKLAETTTMSIEAPKIDDGRQYTILVNGQDCTWAIRSEEVEQMVSIVSAHKAVRAILIQRQQQLGEDLGRTSGVVMAGRDIGTDVLPHAPLKVYLTASLEERAIRRFAQLQRLHREGTEKQQTTLAQVRQEIERRDTLDAYQMRPAKDAWMLATDALTAQEVAQMIIDRVCTMSECG